jgi:hypothetical protein
MQDDDIVAFDRVEIEYLNRWMYQRRILGISVACAKYGFSRICAAAWSMLSAKTAANEGACSRK